MKKPKEPVKNSDVFRCCDREFDSMKAMKEHLEKDHGVTDSKGTRSMQMHLDCADSYDSTFEWTVGGVKFLQYSTRARAINDPFKHV